MFLSFIWRSIIFRSYISQQAQCLDTPVLIFSYVAKITVYNNFASTNIFYRYPFYKNDFSLR